MKRREFVGLVGVGSVIPLAITSCNSQVKETSALSSPRSDGFQAIGTVSDLETQRQLLAENTAVGKVLVVPDPADSNQIIAVNPTCTHAGCTVVWQQDQNAFVCPCHDSKFAVDGKVLQGPANEPLPTYTAKVEGNSVLVKVG
ncbi:MAG TPA: ubiquinol-cytochrome c reductase iron-sulfur subunit [Allocoleopsis sp.]